MRDTQQEIANDVLAVSQIDAVPALLQLLLEWTGMGFAVIARVTARSWTACAVFDRIDFGVKAGDQLDVGTTFCNDVRASRVPIVIDHASIDPNYRTHLTPKLYGFESYISVPIVMAGDQYFGNLCAVDPKPCYVSSPAVVALVERIAKLIASQLDLKKSRDCEHAALINRNSAGEDRDLCIASLADALREPALIDEVLDFVRGRVGDGLALRIADVVRIEDALEAKIKEAREAHPGRKIISHIAVGRSVRCDPQRIQQLSCNLLTNALSHGLPDGPVSFIALVEGDALVIEVWNGGAPLLATDLAAVFAPCWRPTLGGGRGGSGWGLHICWHIAHAHRGSIAVTSTQEFGTQFIARIPLDR